MVTTAASPPRPLHAVQTGRTTTMLWVTLRAIKLTLSLTLILLLPVAGRHLVWHGASPLPDKSLAIGLVIAYAVFVGELVVGRKISSAIDMRIPGRLGVPDSEGASRRATRVPGLVADMVSLIVLSAAAAYAATHAEGDLGTTAFALMLAGACSAVLTIPKIIGIAIRRHIGWQGDLVEMTLSRLVLAAILFTIGRFVAPRGELTDPEVISVAVAGILTVCVMLYVLRHVARGASPEMSPRQGMRNLSEAVADSVLNRKVVAPTNGDRDRGARIAQVAIYGALGAVAVLWLALTLA